MNKMKKLLSSLLVLSMVLSYVPMYALAAEGDPCTVTEGCQGTYNAEGICTVCNLAQPVVTEGTEECQHSGGTATCIDLAVCEKCNEPYGELAAHTGGEATCRAQAVCTVCTAAYGELAAHSYENGVCTGCGDICAHAEYAEGKCIVCGNVESDEPEECQHSGGVATCKEQAVCEKCETAYGELAAHNYGTDADGKCDACGADCSHAEYLDGKCKVCDMDEPVQEPVVLTITAWNWVDDYEIIAPEYMDAVIPGVGTENPIDWETLVELLPAYITAVIDGGEVEIPVTWECETFPEETATGGRYALIAILPEGYALGEDVMGLELEVDLGVAEQLYNLDGDGTAANPYIIRNSNDLHEFVWRVNNNGGTRQTTACAKLMNSIEYYYDNDSDDVADKWYALGSQPYPYTGTFDGNGCTISGLFLSDTEGQNSFIRFLGVGGVVKKLTISGDFSGSSNIGGIAGQNYGTISGCTFTGSVTCTKSNVGSIAGKNFGTITGCRNNGAVTGGENAGGIVGLNDTDGSVERSTNNGSVSGSLYVGGIAGTNNNSIENCHNAGEVTATNKKAGGIVGVNVGTVAGCLNTASVTCPQSSRGGLAGETKSGSILRNSCFSSTSCDANTVGTEASNTKQNTGKYKDSYFQNNKAAVIQLLNGGESGVWSEGTTYPVLGGNVTVTTEYPVWVAGVRITSSNMGNVLGDGTVSYNPQTLTLTLHNANIQYNPANAEAAIRNTYASNETLTITGSGTINAGNGSGIYSNKAKIKLSGGNLVIVGSTNGIVAEKGSLTIDGARVKAVGVQNGTFAVDGILVTMGGGLLSVTGKKAVVYGSYSMGSETYDQLTVATDAILTVESGKTVTVNNRIDSSGEIHVNGTLKIPAGSGFTTISGGTLYIGEKGYRWDNNKYVCITHDWSYTASGNTLNALCQDNNCSTGGSVTINAPALTAYGGTENANARLSADSIGSIEKLSERIKYQKKNADSWDAETTVAPTAVGTYKASLTVEGKTIYVEYAIAKAEPTYTAPTGKTLTYNGAEQDLIALNGTVTGGTMYFKVGDGDWLTDVPKASAAGSYTVYWKIEGYANYADVTGTVTASINKNSITPTVSIPGWTYGDTANVPSVAGNTGDGTVTYTYYTDENYTVKTTTANGAASDGGVPVNADTYYIKADVAESAYYAAASATTSFTIAKKEIGIQWSTEAIIFQENIAQAPTAAATGMVNGDVLSLTVSGAQTNAGTGYTAKVTEITGEKAGNYKLPENVTTTFSIQNASQAKPTGVAGVGETSRNQGDGKLTGVDSTMEYRAENDSTYTAITGEEVTGLAAGKYYVRYKAKTNYDASEDAEVTVSKGRMLKVSLPTEQTGYSLESSANEVAYNGTVTLTYQLAAGYTEGEGFAVTASNGTVTNNGNGTYTISGITGDTTISVTGISDITAPTGEITVTTNKWTEFLNTITFDLFFKATQTVTITAEDAGSGVATIEYYLSQAAMTLEQVKAITTWDGYNSSFSIDAENRYVIYAKVTDRDQNVLYISSDGIVLDKTQPVIIGVTNGATYYTTQKVTATDSAVSGTSTLQSLTGTNADGTISGDPTQETKHTIVATDKAGNSTTLTITMKPISSLRAGLPTEDTVELTDKDAIDAIKKNVSDVLTNQSANATDTEKDKLNAMIADCDKLLKMIENAEAVITLIRALPDASEVEPDDKPAIDAYDTALAAYNALTDNEKRLVGGENKARLDAVRKALTAYDIIHQSAKYHTKGSGKTLIFTANGYYAEYGSYTANAYGKFVSVEVDDKVISSGNYTAAAGSTVITLKTSYLDTLTTGKHTIKVNYTDGSTNGSDTFRIYTDNGNPSTGDDMSPMRMGGMVLTGLLGMAMLLLFYPRKKGKYQR